MLLQFVARYIIYVMFQADWIIS